MYLSIAFIDFDFTAAFLYLFAKFQNLETKVCLDLEVALPDRPVATHSPEFTAFHQTASSQICRIIFSMPN